jgi:hypothetical protein
MRLYLAETFDLSMLSERHHRIECRQLEPQMAALLLQVHWRQTVNVIEWQGLDTIVHELLLLHVPHLVVPEPQPLTVKLAPRDAIIAANYTGPRPEPGRTMLPEGARVTFWLVHQCGTLRGDVVAELMDAYQAGTERATHEAGGIPPSFAHWEGIIWLTQRAEELGAHPAETLEALQQLSTYAFP